MKIARKGLWDVPFHGTKRLSLVSQESQVTWGKVPHTAGPLLSMGEVGRGVKLQ